MSRYPVSLVLRHFRSQLAFWQSLRKFSPEFVLTVRHERIGTMPKFPVLRSELKAGDSLCNHCTAMCCKYFSLPIDTPKTWDDFDNCRWYLTHGRVALFVEDQTWYLVVFGDCQYLTPTNMCGIYSDRPAICGEYTTDGCEYDNDVVFEKYFETPEQIWEYAEAILPPREPLARDKTPSLSLPVLNASRN